MNLFYHPDIESNITLPAEESRHIQKVLRKNIGDIITVTDGKDCWYQCQLVEISPGVCQVKILSKDLQTHKPYHLHLAIAPTKNTDRIEWLMEKAVEIGIHEVSFFITEHSQRRQLKLDRLEKIAISAMKQSLQARLPILHELQRFDQFLETLIPSYQNLMAHLSADSKKIKDVLQRAGQYCILIGPEGDFSDSEIVAAQKKGVELIELGDTRLRTETAGLVAISTVSSMHW
jgi:16S rRNA (uracil1498-N3)-methyltransferase